MRPAAACMHRERIHCRTCQLVRLPLRSARALPSCVTGPLPFPLLAGRPQGAITPRQLLLADALLMLLGALLYLLSCTWMAATGRSLGPAAGSLPGTPAASPVKPPASPLRLRVARAAAPATAAPQAGAAAAGGAAAAAAGRALPPAAVHLRPSPSKLLPPAARQPALRRGLSAGRQAADGAGSMVALQPRGCCRRCWAR